MEIQKPNAYVLDDMKLDHAIRFIAGHVSAKQKLKVLKIAHELKKYRM